jgi:hypothetical protein
MTVQQYSSLDASAPVLTGETGKLNDLLRAILVDGYGAISGAGWGEAYSDAGTKTKVWRPAAGPRHYFQVQDNGPGVGTFKEARIRAYVAMSSYNTGTEPFPTVAQAANGQFIRKSTTADATARAWRAVADDQSIYLGVATGDVANQWFWSFFGRIRSWKAADAYESAIACQRVENTNLMTVNNYAFFQANYSLTAVIGIWLPRSYTALGTAVEGAIAMNQTPGGTSTNAMMGSQGISYPNAVDGGILLSQAYLSELNIVRGTFPGLWIPNHAKPILHDDTFTATDGAVTRTFIACNLSTTGQFMLETSDTWYND